MAGKGRGKGPVPGLGKPPPGAVLPSSHAPRRRRPSVYDPEVAAVICARVAAGEALTAICAEPGMPSHSGFFDWLADSTNAELHERYARAREKQADSLFDHAQTVAAQALAGQVDPQAARLWIDTVKWRAGKLRPKVYGDKIEIDQTISIRAQSLAERMDAIDAIDITPAVVQLNQGPGPEAQE